ncbi:odorant-binding protein 73a [Musca autumnalis]|uniref:odorant-binding protein 73a n=1 Tax=Musca autumnalis TaxID=221902 RepID=UPI003CE6EB9D
MVLNVMLIQGYAGSYHYHEKTRCLNPPRTARKVETFIRECQDEVKNKLVQEAFSILRHEVAKFQPPINLHDDTVEYMETTENSAQMDPWQENTKTEDATHFQDHNQNQYEYFPEEDTPRRRMARLVDGISRVDDLTNGIYHPTLVPFEDKRIAGCLLHCVYAKNNAIDKNGWPTLDGLVDFYSGGVNEHGFFMATLRSVNLCLRAVTNKYHVNRRQLPEKGESCDLAFDVFDCISDQITGYCLDQYKS